LARQQGLTEELIAEIPHYQQSAMLTPREKAAIRFAETLAGDHRRASQELFDELRQYFTEPEIIDLGWRIVTFVGYGRFIHALGLEIGQTCPLSFSEKDKRQAAD
jgi:alkylhydroperoxidase family enzyme